MLRSFELVGATLNEAQRDSVFQRIYSVFGSLAAYERFDDALPFLHWANRNGIACGLLSNADDRYSKFPTTILKKCTSPLNMDSTAQIRIFLFVGCQYLMLFCTGDSILPMLELTHDELQFQCFSKDYGVEKPDSRFFMAAIKDAEASLSDFSSSVEETRRILKDDPLHPSQVLHIGNDFVKDFEGARRVGMHAVLLDRYDEAELAAEWKRRGAVVLKDLMDVVEFVGRSNCQLGIVSKTNV